MLGGASAAPVFTLGAAEPSVNVWGTSAANTNPLLGVSAGY